MSPLPDGALPSELKIGTRVGLAAMCVGMFMAILDVQVVTTSLPTIQGALGIAPDQMSWVQTAWLCQVACKGLDGALALEIRP